MKKYCKKCGFVDGEGDIDVCPICKSTDWEDADLITLKEISTDKDFLEAMIDLKKKDPIEYQLKISQFKTQVKQQEQAEESKKEENTIHCPTCNSTNVNRISTTAKATNTILFGIFGTKRHKTFHCNNCKYEW